MQLAAAILAAGKGTRMKSRYPKVIHKICGRPMIDYVLEAVKNTGASPIVVVAGYEGDLVKEVVGSKAKVVYQQPQLGTAHALLQTKVILKDFFGQLLVTCGDTPLITPETLSDLVVCHRETGASATVLTTRMVEPASYGRVIRGEEKKVLRIVEQKDASLEEQLIQEVNTGIYCFEASDIFPFLEEVSSDNAQDEFYLTDVVRLMVKKELKVEALLREGNISESVLERSAGELASAMETKGINDRYQLAEVEKFMRHRVLKKLMVEGVTIIDPGSTFIDHQVQIGIDTIIYPFTVIEGRSIIGENCVIGPCTRLVDMVIGAGVTIQNSVVQSSLIEDNASIGPFAHIRPDTKVGRKVKIGNFVETKKSVIGEGSKVSHLSYIGDADIGKEVNIGAGTITCNYDGIKKWPTRIKDGAFIGSNTSLVAPVEIGSRSIVAAGSAITKNVPDKAMGVARGRQKNLPGWVEKKQKIEGQEKKSKI